MDASLRFVWGDRPVGVMRSDGVEHPVGHFDLLVCRGCGYTVWYALDYAVVSGSVQPTACRECKSVTRQISLHAVERSAWSALVEAALTRARTTVPTRTGETEVFLPEGTLAISVCTGCDRVAWNGIGYLDLTSARSGAYEVRAEPRRRCLACDASDAIVDDRVQELDWPAVPVAVAEKRWLFGALRYDALVGHLGVRLCRPCGAVEWYAHDFARLAHDPANGVFALGEPPAGSLRQGPYR